MRSSCCPPISSAGRLILGVAVILLGVLFTLDNLGLLDAEDYVRFWPLALVALGFSKVFSRRSSDLVFAAIWIGLGSWFLLYNLEVVDVEPWEFFWPIVFTLVGANLILGAVRRERVSEADAAEQVRATAFTGHVRRQSAGQRFRGGDLSAVMGGCEVDLRQAKMEAGEEAIIHVFAFWGGIEIQVPPHWTVDPQALVFLGGLSDLTEPTRDDGPRLVIKGSVIMGGMELKN